MVTEDQERFSRRSKETSESRGPLGKVVKGKKVFAGEGQGVQNCFKQKQHREQMHGT